MLPDIDDCATLVHATLIHVGDSVRTCSCFMSGDMHDIVSTAASY